MVWFFDDTICFIEAALPVDPIYGGKINTCDGPGKVHHFLQPPSNRFFQVTELGLNVTSQHSTLFDEFIERCEQFASRKLCTLIQLKLIKD